MSGDSSNLFVIRHMMHILVFPGTKQGAQEIGIFVFHPGSFESLVIVEQ